MGPSAADHKALGNNKFKAGDYKGAEADYTRAIQLDPADPLFYTNRAFSRVKLQAWEQCVEDCLKSIELQRDNMKAFYYLAQAQIALHQPNVGLTSALTAYDLCQKSGNASISNICNLILEAKKQKWEMRDRERRRRHNPLCLELEESLRKNAGDELSELKRRQDLGEISFTAASEERADISDIVRVKIEDLQNVFAIADPEHMQRREVPDYLIDQISFSVMHDPVLTKTGQSYERATILEHLRHSKTDPLTREPLSSLDLRPNLALKEDCAKFLEENGWAVDW